MYSNSMWKLFLSFVLLVGAGCALPIQLDSGPLRTRAGQPYHWQVSDFPIPVYIQPAMSPVRKAGTLLAMYEWNILVGTEVFVVVEDVPANFPMFEANGAFPMRGYVSVEDGACGINQAGQIRRGLATVALRSGLRELAGQIHSSRIIIDVGIFSVSTANRVSFHELGHALGLAHDINDRTSIMWTSATASSLQQLQEQDLDFVRRQTGVWTFGLADLP